MRNGVTARGPVIARLRAAGLAIAAAAALVAGPAKAGDGRIECSDGFAGEFPCEGVDFLAFMSLDELGGGADTRAANLWGWTDPQTDREYVLVGLTDATAFVDVTESTAPLYLGSLPTHTSSSIYRDIKVYLDHAFIIADLPSLHGMQVFDLTQLRDVTNPPVIFAASAHFDGFGDAHNLFINTESGFAYAVRTTTPDLCGGALYVVDIRDPLEPSFAGCVDEGGLASDSYCAIYAGDDVEFQGREVCVLASDDDIIVVDVTDKGNPSRLATLGYADIARAHNAWLTADHNYFVSVDMNDELESGNNTRIFVWDFRDVDAPALIGIYDGPSASSDHNIWVRGRKAYVGNFRAGLRILDLTGIASGELTQDSFFDMIPEDDNPGHNGGAWAVYPFFPSRVLAVTDKEVGLYLVKRVARAYATLRYAYTMNDETSGSGVYTLWDDWTFTDSEGAGGEWTFRFSTPRMVLQHAAGDSCGARFTTRFLGDGRIGGPRVCQDGSGVRGVWRGTVVP